MIKQSFSEKNIRKIYDLENRKGNNLEKIYFPDVVILTEKISCIKKKIKNYLRMDKHDFGRLIALKYYRKIKKEFEKEKEELLIKKLENISLNILSNNYEVSLSHNKLKGKDIYTANTDTPEIFFLLKQLQFNLKNLYVIKQANRNFLLSQLKIILSNGFSKMTFKIDISSFYESIPRVDVIQTIQDDPKLSLQTRKTICYIFECLEKKYANKIGIPRGIGLSAYLAEHYMKSFDDFFKTHPECSYYSRYVDDIIIVFNPSSDFTNEIIEKEYLKIINDQLRKKQLKLNNNKKVVIKNNENKTFDYLGYTFHIKSGSLEKINLTQKRYDNYIKKIELCFKSYFRQFIKSPNKANVMLKSRLRYLTSNTRLVHNKKNVMTGIYFSNKFITDYSQLEDLDNHLKNKVNLITDPSLQTQLRTFSFKKGFKEKIYVNFPKKFIKEIQQLWKYSV
ncbi:antiviral reverse transcriptase Drt3a [Gilliamella sp. App4-10]|uniref:antiviral reverse transcriptase Drt3a n=1 Tax=Gilliamella sp. App4-10 TaxID=3120231 RepID=UPI00080D9B22|nr:antiviral reverse transcriptase Drt3a [Gilliamella apicola]OCG20509.1 hypothetical protein A9G23_06710 [Gilliamella apicola]